MNFKIGDKVRVTMKDARVGNCVNPETGRSFSVGDVAIVTEVDFSDDTVRLNEGRANWKAIEELENLSVIKVGDSVMVMGDGHGSDNPDTGLPFKIGDIGLVTEINGIVARVNEGLVNNINLSNLKSMEEFKMSKTVEELIKVVEVASVGTELEGKLVVNDAEFSPILNGEVVMIGNTITNNEIHALFIDVEKVQICGLVTRNFEPEESLVEMADKIKMLVPKSNIEYQEEPNLFDILAYTSV